MLHAALRIDAEIKLFSAFDGSGAERPMDLVFEELNRHLGSNNFDLRVQVNQVSNQS